jgi:uncharacterized protein (DUF983 family)
MEAGVESGILAVPLQTAMQTEIPMSLPMSLALRRGALGQCPSCGKTRLFASYLKQVDVCSNCGASFGRIRADDAAPWGTIIVVGHIFMPLIFFVNLEVFMPFWVGVFTWAALFTGLSLAVLPRAKGFFIALLWVTRAPGVNNG